jgi:hypothetical protein
MVAATQAANTMFLTAFTPGYTYAQNLVKQESRAEIGIALLNNSLSFEERIIAVDGTDLAKGLTDAKPSTLAIDLAALLPPDLAMAFATCPPPAGTPDPIAPMRQSISAVLSALMPPDTAAPFLKSLNNLFAQTTQGCAIGVTAVPTYKEGTPTIEAVFQVKSADEAQTAIRDFVRDFKILSDNAIGGALAQSLDLQIKPAAEKVGDVEVDVIKLVISGPPPTVGPPPRTNVAAVPPAAPPVLKELFSLEWRIAYVDDKMLFTLGKDGQNEMITLVDRVQNQTPGFTASARFKALKGNAFPAAPQSFYYLAPGDLVRTIGAILPDLGDAKSEAVQLQQIITCLPPQRTAMYSYGEIKDGMIYSDTRVPLEQLDLFYMTGKAITLYISARMQAQAQMQQMIQNTRPAPNASLAGTIVNHPDIEGGIWTVKLDNGDEYVLAGTELEKLLATPQVEGKRAILKGTMASGAGAAVYGKGTFNVISFQILP